MASNEVAVLDIGSSSVTVLIGERGVNNTISILGRGTCEYEGFFEGKFCVPEGLKSVIGHAIATAEANSRTQITHLTIGVPAEFVVTECRQVQRALERRRRITADDLDALHQRGNDFDDHPSLELINIQPINYVIDDDRKHPHPIGLVSTRLGGNISYTLCSREFVALLSQCMQELEVSSFEFCSSMLAQVLFLFDEAQRDQTVVLIDVGYMTTAVAVARGDGILHQSCFSLGGGIISCDLIEHLAVPPNLVESLKKEVVLSLDPSPNDDYKVGASRDQQMAFPAIAVNALVTRRISHIARTVSRCLAGVDFAPNTPFFLTGGGLAYIRGARDLLGKQLDQTVEIIAPNFPQYNRPHLSSELGLLDMVLKQQTATPRKGLFGRIFG